MPGLVSSSGAEVWYYSHVTTYQVTIERTALRALERIERRDRDRITDAIRGLATDPRPAGCVALQGRAGYRIRVGSYRVVYEVDDGVRIVTVAKVGHRRDVYER